MELLPTIRECSMPTTYEAQTREIVEQVREWPVEAPRELVQDILSTFVGSVNGGPARSLKDLLGAMKTNDRPLSDEECRKILEEELLRKHVR
jgi:hypothetical protein